MSAKPAIPNLRGEKCDKCRAPLQPAFTEGGAFLAAVCSSAMCRTVHAVGKCKRKSCEASGWFPATVDFRNCYRCRQELADARAKREAGHR